MLKHLRIDLHLLKDVLASLCPETGASDDDHFGPIEQAIQAS
jgi:hypothetical protein